MSDNKHTPGPWEYAPSTDAHGPYVSGPYGDVADCYTMTNPNHAAVVNGGDSQPHHFCGEEADANARLIASAPELLEALEAMINNYVALANSGDCGNWDPEEEPQIIAARAAIAKARGES